MKLTIVSSVFLIHIFAYGLLSRKTGSWINVLTPQYLTAIPTLFVAEIINLVGNSSSASDFSYFIVYSCYALQIISFVLAYIFISPSRTLLEYSTTIRDGRWMGAFALMCAVGMYLPVIADFWQDLFNPRAIYIATRTGFGLFFFISIFFCYIGFILILFDPKCKWMIKMVAGIFSCFFAYIHGSKGQVLAVIFIAMLYVAVHLKKKVNFTSFVKIMIPFLMFGSGVFFMMSTGLDVENLVEVMAGYSDFSRNAALLVDSNASPELGKIFFEDNVYSRIPRAFDPDKPKDFGAFALAKEYFPAAFDNDQGVPSFGIGTYYADFGLFCVPILMFAGFFSGMMTRVFVERTARFRSPADFIVLCFFCGIPIIPVGSGYLLPEYVLTGLLVYFLGRRRLVL